MNLKPLTADQAEALHAAGDKLPVIDQSDPNRIFVVVDMDVHERAMKALRESEVADQVQQAAVGPGMSIVESQRRTIKAIQDGV